MSYAPTENELLAKRARRLKMANIAFVGALVIGGLSAMIFVPVPGFDSGASQRAIARNSKSIASTCSEQVSTEFRNPDGSVQRVETHQVAKPCPDKNGLGLWGVVGLIAIHIL